MLPGRSLLTHGLLELGLVIAQVTMTASLSPCIAVLSGHPPLSLHKWDLTPLWIDALLRGFMAPLIPHAPLMATAALQEQARARQGRHTQRACLSNVQGNVYGRSLSLQEPLDAQGAHL
jgi:hypothetical protein